MKRNAVVLYLTAFAVALPISVQAQTEKDFAAWTAMMVTPVGALPPVMLVPSMKGGARAGAFAFSASRWKFDGSGEEANYNYGISYAHPVAQKAMASGTLAYMRPGCSGGGCDGTLMLGGDLQAPVWENATVSSGGQTTFGVNLKGSLGWGRFLGSGNQNALSLVGTVPLTARFTMSNKSLLSAFLAPGFGFGRITFGGSPSESGSRPLVGGGIAWTSADGIGVHLGIQKILIKETFTKFPTNVGLALSIAK